MERLLEDAEKLSGIRYDISSFADVTEAIHVVQTELGITGTTAKEAAATVEGSIGAMKAAWQNLITGIGREDADLDRLVNDFVKTAETALDNLMPVVERALQGFGALIEKLGPIISAKMPGFIAETTPVLAQAVGQIFGGVVANLPLLVGGFFEGIGMALDQAFHIEHKDYYIDEYGQLTYAMDEVGETAAKTGGRMGAEFAEGLDMASAVSEKFAVKQMELAEAAQGAAQGVEAATEEEIAAAEAAKASLLEIGGAAIDARYGAGDLRAAYEELATQFEAVDTSASPALAAMVEAKLAALNLAATNQELAGAYPELVSQVGNFGYSITELSAWLIDNGVTAEEWGSQVLGTVDGIVNGFGRLDTDLGMSLEEMATNLRANIDAYSNWRTNIDEMMAAAVASGDAGAIAFVQHMESMGVGAAVQVQQMHDNMETSFATFGPMFGEAIDQGVLAAYENIENSNISGAVDGMNQEVIDAVASMDIGDAGSQLPAQVATNITGNTEAVTTAVTAVATEAVGAFDDTDFAPSGTAAVEEIASGISDAVGTVEDAATAAAEAAVAAFDAVDAAPSGEAFDSELAAGIEALSGDVGGAAEAVANAAAEAAKIDTTDVGEYFSQGLAAGIAAGRSGVINAAVEVMEAAVAAAKNAGAIASPSKVMRDEVGVWLTRGIAAGMVDPDALYALEESADTVQEYIARLFGVDLNGEDSDAIKAVKAWKDAWEGALDDTVRSGEHSIFLMEKNGKDYNEIIGVYRSLQKAVHEQAEQGRRMGLTENDRYIQELQKDWWNYEDKIQSIEKERADEEEKARKARQKAVEEALDSELKAMRDMADELTDEYQSAYNEIMKAQENMQSKLAGYGELFHLTGTTVSLESLDSQTKFIERYGAVLDKLEARGINGSLLNEILGMDVKNATLYGEKLMQMSGWEWDRYMGSYQRKQDAAARISERFFGDEIQELNDSYVKNASEQVGGLFRQFLSEIPEGDELSGYMAQTLTETFEGLMQEMLEPILGGNIGDLLQDGGTAGLASAREAAADTRAAERDQTLVTAMGDMASAIVNGIDASMETHMGQGESELSVEVGGELLARILLPYLIATAKANGTPIVNEGG